MIQEFRAGLAFRIQEDSARLAFKIQERQSRQAFKIQERQSRQAFKIQELLVRQASGFRRSVRQRVEWCDPSAGGRRKVGVSVRFRLHLPPRVLNSDCPATPDS